MSEKKKEEEEEEKKEATMAIAKVISMYTYIYIILCDYFK